MSSNIPEPIGNTIIAYQILLRRNPWPPQHCPYSLWKQWKKPCEQLPSTKHQSQFWLKDKQWSATPDRLPQNAKYCQQKKRILAHSPNKFCSCHCQWAGASLTGSAVWKGRSLHENDKKAPLLSATSRFHPGAVNTFKSNQTRGHQTFEEPSKFAFPTHMEKHVRYWFKPVWPVFFGGGGEKNSDVKVGWITLRIPDLDISVSSLSVGSSAGGRWRRYINLSLSVSSARHIMPRPWTKSRKSIMLSWFVSSSWKTEVTNCWRDTCWQGWDKKPTTEGNQSFKRWRLFLRTTHSWWQEGSETTAQLKPSQIYVTYCCCVAHACQLVSIHFWVTQGWHILVRVRSVLPGMFLGPVFRQNHQLPKVTAPGKESWTDQSPVCTVRSRALSGRTCPVSPRELDACASSKKSNTPPVRNNSQTDHCSVTQILLFTG